MTELFAGGGEGKFYVELRADKTIFSDFFRELYYNRNYEGRFYSNWSNFEQSIWIVVLILSLAAAFVRERELQVFMLSIVGISLFELIFEARARYLFIYVPFYIVLATRGISVLHGIYCTGRIRKQSRELGDRKIDR